MKQIYNVLKDSVCSALVTNATHVLGEREANVKDASKSIIASLLGLMVKKGDTQQIKNILNEASNLHILSDAENICRENPTANQRKIADDFLQQLLGDKASDFTDPIAAHSGISKVAANRLIYMIAPLVAGHLGDFLQKDHRSLAALINQLKEEKSSFASFIPSGLAERFRLSPATHARVVASAHTPTAKMSAPIEPTPQKEATRSVVEKKKKGSNWIKWLLLLLLLLLLFFWWRSCQSPVEQAQVIDREQVTNTQVAPPAVTPPAATVSSDPSRLDLTLPDGQILNVLKGSMEEKMITFLNSDAYANATEKELQDKWFEFDQIDFKYDSTTELLEHSEAQLKNVMAIIKSYPQAKVIIAGFADKKGTEEVNLEVSKARAQTIANYFKQDGLDKQVVRVEGLGEKYATRSADAPDSERAKDRDIALRFVK